MHESVFWLPGLNLAPAFSPALAGNGLGDS